jgi:hypothetical protein
MQPKVLLKRIVIPMACFLARLSLAAGLLFKGQEWLYAVAHHYASVAYRWGLAPTRPRPRRAGPCLETNPRLQV